MTALLVVETIVLVLLTLMVAGLLRSHAEILRRLNNLDATAPTGNGAGAGRGGAGASGWSWASEGERHPDWLPRPRAESTPAYDIVGITLGGQAVHVGISGSPRSTLLAFLSSGCATCARFWDAFRANGPLPMPGDARLVIVTKDSTHETPSKLRDLAPRDVPVIMSTAAWDAYGVPLSPYFIYVQAQTGEVVGEGSAGHWGQVESLLRDALADAELAGEESGSDGVGQGGEDGRRRASTAGRLARMDAELAAAGIGPGHPSLYAGDEPPPEEIALRRKDGGKR